MFATKKFFLYFILCLVGTCAISGFAVEPVAPTLLAPPNGYQAIGPGSGLLRLTWEKAEGAFGYEVRVSQPSGQFQNFVRFTSHTEIPFGSVREGTFEWKARCVYADPKEDSRTERVFGPWSDPWTFGIVRASTGDINPNGPVAPTVVFPSDAAVLIAGNDYEFVWTEVPGAMQYQIELKTPRGSDAKIVPGTTWTFRGTAWSRSFGRDLPPEGMYGFRVRAISRNGRGTWSQPVGFEFKYDGDHSPCWGREISMERPPALIAPEDKAVLSPLGEGLVGLFSWEAVENAQRYEILFTPITPAPARDEDGRSGDTTWPRPMWEPPTSALVEDTTYALVVPDIPGVTAGARFVWKVRAIVAETRLGQEKLLPTYWSMPRSFTIGPVSVPDVTGETIELLSPPDGAVFSGPTAAIPFAWDYQGRDQVCQVTIRDETGDVVIRQYRRGHATNVEIKGLGKYSWQVETVRIARGGGVETVGPASEKWTFEIRNDSVVDDSEQLGDLVKDGAVDSGDAIRALRHSTDPENNPLRVEEVWSGDCNGDGRVDSGDAVYMLRKSVGSTH